MTESSEEDDYMSESFLTKTIETDVRPGLVNSHKIARKMKLEEKKERLEAELKHKQKPIKQLEVERREEGLNVALSSDNKGFSMLAKMGYKQGDSIGRSNTGIVEPIPIQVKTNRAGLGREAALKQLEEYKEKLRSAKIQQNTETNTSSISQFRQRMAQRTNDRQLEADLSKCQRACEKLDLDAAIETPVMKFFWPLRQKTELTETIEDPYDDKNETEPKRRRKDSNTSSSDESEKCKRFGVDFDSDESSSSSESEDEIKQTIQEITTVDPDDEENEYEPSDKLEMLIAYLRTTYCYCHWCGVHYEDTDDMDSNCPGTTKDDH